ncbi:RNA-directed DNA polymerase [Anabaena sphaerica FACHB-251]|uniref:RNA-directed DNA polymerase n=2 Tax=Anabaena TaxID=1163 RepID=A0A926WDC9_9NOST|nr:RNA-directed DNA polymerase [Anabaena sphaerica FACHB-251]
MNTNHLITIGISLYQENKYSEAIDCFNKIISTDSNCCQAYHYRGLVLRKQRDDQGAIADLKKADTLIADQEYTNIFQKLQNLIGKDYSHFSKNNDNDEFSYIEYKGTWHLEQEIYDLISSELNKLENFLSSRLQTIELLRKKRAENSQFNQERLENKNLPTYNSHEEIAQAMGISVKGLRFLSFSRKNDHYIRFQIPKKPSGYRQISAPKKLLKKAQNWILDNILEKLELHDAAHGFRLKHSIVTNAQIHVGKEVIINIDLKDFFPSISYKRVKGLFKSFGYSETASTIFALICTEAKIKEVEINGEINSLLSWTDRYLPQGAPSSPAITNILCRRLDRKLTFMAKQYGFDYTRYADDLTFSASGESLVNVNNILKLTNLIVKKEDFEINENKTRVVRNYRRQEVTGVIVNEKLNIPRDKLKTFRAVLYKIEKDGLQNYTWGQSKDIIAAIEGFANFVSMVNPEKGGKFIEQIHRIKEKYGIKKDKISDYSPVIRTQSYIINQIYYKLSKLSYSKTKRRMYLTKTYNKRSLQELTEEQLVEFLNYLKNLQSSFDDLDEPPF